MYYDSKWSTFIYFNVRFTTFSLFTVVNSLNPIQLMASRKQSFVGGDGFEILFDGSKSYWKTRSNLDILVASHKKQLCIEVVAYNAEIGVEAPRLYISSMMLSTKINPQGDDFVAKLSAKKEAFNRQKKSYSVPELTKEVYNELMLDYIMRRLNVVSEGVDLAKELKMTITPQSGDAVKEDDPTQVDFIIEMPPTLTPVAVTYQKKARFVFCLCSKILFLSYRYVCFFKL